MTTELEEPMNATTKGNVAAQAEPGEAAPQMALGIGTLAILAMAAYLLFIVGPPLLAEPVPFSRHFARATFSIWSAARRHSAGLAVEDATCAPDEFTARG